MSNLSPENSGIFYGTKPYVAADGVQTATIKVRLRDYQNLPIIGRQAEIIADREDVVIVQPGLTDSTGTATATVSTTVPGPVTISARVLPLE
jgi:hypothetical protein